jgi:hypothetical protein
VREWSVAASLVAIRREDLRLKAYRARSTPPIFNQILLAAFLKLCNAAENFLRAELENPANQAGFMQKSRFFESLGSPGDANSPPEILPTVESPAATERALCLLL